MDSLSLSTVNSTSQLSEACSEPGTVISTFYDPVRNTHIDVRNESSLASARFAITGSIPATSMNSSASHTRMSGGGEESALEQEVLSNILKKVQEWILSGQRLMKKLSEAKPIGEAKSRRGINSIKRAEGRLKSVLLRFPRQRDLVQEDPVRLLTEIILVTRRANRFEGPAIDFKFLPLFRLRTHMFGETAATEILEDKRAFIKATEELSSLMEVYPALITKVNSLLAEGTIGTETASLPYSFILTGSHDDSLSFSRLPEVSNETFQAVIEWNSKWESIMTKAVALMIQMCTTYTGVSTNGGCHVVKESLAFVSDAVSDYAFADPVLRLAVTIQVMGENDLYDISLHNAPGPEVHLLFKCRVRPQTNPGYEGLVWRYSAMRDEIKEAIEQLSKLMADNPTLKAKVDLLLGKNGPLRQ